jgi:hypothetical protein
MKWTLLGCSIALCLTANLWAQVPDPDSELGEEMQTLVKSYITRNPEVSVDDAITRLAIQTEIMQSMEDLRQEFSDRLTEISLQHTPDQHILVELKGAGAVADRVVRTESGTTRVVFETGHKYTKQEFYAILDKHMDLLYSAIPGATGFPGRPGEDRLVIYIEGNEQEAEELQTTVKRLERILGFAITLRPTMSKSRNVEYIQGGAVLKNNNSFCTPRYGPSMPFQPRTTTCAQSCTCGRGQSLARSFASGGLDPAGVAAR